LNCKPLSLGRQPHSISLIYIFFTISLLKESSSEIILTHDTLFRSWKKYKIYDTILLRTELMRTRRPPIYMSFPLRLLRHFSNLSWIIFHSAFESFRYCIKIPKYRMENCSCSQLNNLVYRPTFFCASLKQNNSLLWKLIIRPKSCSNADKFNFTF
jgi:hypothetical protein